MAAVLEAAMGGVMAATGGVTLKVAPDAAGTNGVVAMGPNLGRWGSTEGWWEARDDEAECWEA